MKPDRKSWTLRIMHGPFNADFAEASGFIFKLSYQFDSAESPRLEIFADSQEARASEWKIYGAVHNDADDRFAKVQFSAPGDVNEFRLGSSKFRIAFEKFCVDDFVYPDGSKEPAPVYEFIVELMS